MVFWHLFLFFNICSKFANSQVRIEAALALRTLAEVDPTCVGGLTSYGVTNLTALRESVSFEKVKFVKVYIIYISLHVR